jgi:hypothetical protein
VLVRCRRIVRVLTACARQVRDRSPLQHVEVGCVNRIVFRLTWGVRGRQWYIPMRSSSDLVRRVGRRHTRVGVCRWQCR